MKPLVVHLTLIKRITHTNYALSNFFITIKSTKTCCSTLGGEGDKAAFELATTLFPLLFDTQGV